MNYIKSTLLLGFSMLTVLCVGYAHSEDMKDEVPGAFYETNNLFFPNCNLMVEFNSNSVNFRIPGFSNLIFKGFWPKSEGDVFMSTVQQGGEASVKLIGVDEADLNDQNLVVRFAKVNGGIHPVGYFFRDLKLQRANNLSAGAIKNCLGLHKVR